MGYANAINIMTAKSNEGCEVWAIINFVKDARISGLLLLYWAKRKRFDENEE